MAVCALRREQIVPDEKSPLDILMAVIGTGLPSRILPPPWRLPRRWRLLFIRNLAHAPLARRSTRCGTNSLSNSADPARQERALRKKIRNSLESWCRFALEARDQAPAEHHLLVLRALEDLDAGRVRRLMLLLPPGSAKSTYASVLFPACVDGAQSGGIGHSREPYGGAGRTFRGAGCADCWARMGRG